MSERFNVLMCKFYICAVVGIIIELLLLLHFSRFQTRIFAFCEWLPCNVMRKMPIKFWYNNSNKQANIKMCAILRKSVYTKPSSVIKVVCFLLSNSPASEFYMPTFRNTPFHLHRRVGMKNDWVQNVGVFIRERWAIGSGYFQAKPFPV